MANIIIVMPILNEITGIKDLVRNIDSLKINKHYLFVDDGSSDGSREFLVSLNKKNSIKYQLFFRNNKKRGLGNAYRDAIRSLKKTKYEYVILMDGDGSHDPELIPKMLKYMEKFRPDLVVGSRYNNGGQIENWAFNRRIISRFGNYFCNFTAGNFKVKDWTTGFRLWQKQMLDKVVNKTTANGYSFLIETTYYCLENGGQIYEYPIVFQKRVSGESKFSFKIFNEALKVVWSLRWRKK